MEESRTSGIGARRGVVIGLALVLLSMAALVLAVTWVGGVSEVARILGIGEQPVAEAPVTPAPQPDSVPPADDTTPTPSNEATPQVSVDPTPTPIPDPTAAQPSAPAAPPADRDAQAAVVFPISTAQAAMYREQLQSQSQINRLVNGDITSLALGAAATGPNRATVPVTVRYRAGGSLTGTMVLGRTDGLWYFLSIAAAGGAESTPRPRTIDSGVVRTISQQQGTAANQDLINRGILQRGFTTARVDGVTRGSGTATVHVTLLGGSLDRKPARFVLVSKDDSGRKYWFITRFELK